jgi:hypothetical protein
MENWVCIWDDLLRLFGIALEANPKVEFNLGPNPLQYLNLSGQHMTPNTEKHLTDKRF